MIVCSTLVGLHMMFPSIRSTAVVLLLSAAPTLGQFPAEPAGIKVLESRFGDGVTITYKEVHAKFYQYFGENAA